MLKRILQNILEHTGRQGSTMSMQKRFTFYVIVFFTIITLIIGIISLTFSQYFTGRRRIEQFAKKEFSLLYNSMSNQCGETVSQLVNLSQSLSRSIENQLLNRQIQAGALAEHPGILEEIIGNELSRLQLALERTGNSGVYLILNATVNPSLLNAEHSRAGLYIRNSEPSMTGVPEKIWRFYRGAPNIAYQNGLQLQVEWGMEFDVRKRDFFHLPLENARLNNHSLPMLYYWSSEGIIPSLDETVLLCSIPLIDSNGTAFGVCGFDSSAWSYDIKYQPDNSEYHSIVSVFSRIEEDKLNIKTALLSGASLEIRKIRNSGTIFHTASGGLNLYRLESGDEYIGLHEEILMYPADSAFAEQHFALTLLISKREVDALTRRINMLIIAICTVLFVLGIAASSHISKSYVKPIEQSRIIAQKKINMLEHELQQSQISVMLSQIQPHFLYNSLVVIQQLCKIDPKMAEETVVEFADYLRGNLDSLATNVPIPFEKELRHVETYLAIEKKRFGDLLNVKYDIKKKDFSLPALTLQAIVENAVRYGVTKKRGGGTIQITTGERIGGSASEGCAMITVADDGVGYNTERKLQDSRSHIGIDNARYRLASICGGTIEIQSKPGEGTIVTILIPLLQRDKQ